MKRMQTNLINNIKINTIDMKKHREMLRRALLTSSYWERKQTQSLFWKGGEEIMKRHKLLTSGIVIGVTVAALASGVILLPKNAKTAYAEQLAQQSYQAVSNLSSEQQAQLKEKVHMDPSELLQEAKKAKDLKTLTYDEFIKENSMVKMNFSTDGRKNVGYGQVAPTLGQPEKMDLQNLTFLQFTDSTENKVTLGIDKNNLPVFSFIQGKDGNVGFGVRGNGTSGNNPMYGSVQIKNGETKNPGAKVEYSTRSNDGKTLTVNGKEYVVPTGATEQSTVKVDGDNVYIDGIKANPKE